MALPDPVPGLILSYAYLWSDEAQRGQVEGRKDRPCVIVLTVRKTEGRRIVTVAPVTHRPPTDMDSAIEIPAATKSRLGLDADRSWIIADDLNQFVWPGVDLRPVAGGGSGYTYGFLPSKMFARLRDKVLVLARAGRAAVTARES